MTADCAGAILALVTPQWQPIESAPTQAMLTAGARSIGNTMREDNFRARSLACWNAMQAARVGIEEARPNGGESALPAPSAPPAAQVK